MTSNINAVTGNQSNINSVRHNRRILQQLRPVNYIELQTFQTRLATPELVSYSFSVQAITREDKDFYISIWHQYVNEEWKRYYRLPSLSQQERINAINQSILELSEEDIPLALRFGEKVYRVKCVLFPE